MAKKQSKTAEKTIDISESMLKATLNVQKREAFVRAILKDAFGARSEKLEADYKALIEKLATRTWGETPQARGALKKKVAKLMETRDEMKNRGVEVQVYGPTNRILSLTVNAAGLVFELACSLDGFKPYRWGFQKALQRPDKYTKMYVCGDSVTLKSGDPLIDELHRIKDECEALKEAAEVLAREVETVIAPCRTFGKALEVWPGLAPYAEAILSTSRAVAVRPEDLDKRIEALKFSGETVAEIMADKGGK